MLIVDAHTHVYPDKIAFRAVKGIGDFYDIPMVEDGTAHTLLKRMREAGVKHAVISSCATTPEQVSHINAFIASCVEDTPRKFTGLGILHPLSKKMEEDVEQIVRLGLHGVKMHHDFQKFRVDDPRCMKIYELLSGRLPILLHTGDKRYDYTNPDRVEPVLKAFPKLQVIGAHLGGWSIWDKAVDRLAKYDNFFVDCSSTLYAVTPEKACEVIRHYGTERVMFGTDYPMWNASEEMERFERLGFTGRERDLILGENALRIYGIDRAVIEENGQ